jgi:potassium/hydrogen antiporter
VLVLMLVQVPLIRVAGRRLGVVKPDDPVELELESAPLDGMNAQVLGLQVPEGSGLVGTFVTEIGLPEGAVVSLIVRGDQAVAPDVHARVRAGDQLVIVTTEEARSGTEARIQAVARHGRLAAWLDPR